MTFFCHNLAWNCFKEDVLIVCLFFFFVNFFEDKSHIEDKKSNFYEMYLDFNNILLNFVSATNF